MGTSRSARRTARERARHETAKRKNYRLHQAKLEAARKALGTATETETIERALDLVMFGQRLASGTRRARGRPWNDLTTLARGFPRGAAPAPARARRRRRTGTRARRTRRTVRPPRP